MEAEITKKTLSTSFPSASLTEEVLSEGDTIVPDSKPDIGKILLCEANCYHDKIEVQKGRVIFTGTAVFTVLYAPEESEGVKSVTAKFPFNHIAEAEGLLPEDKFEFSFKAVHSECALINSRKLSLKCVIQIAFTAYSTVSLPVCTEISADSIELKKEQLCTSYISAAAGSSFTVSDDLFIPEAKEPAEEILLSRCGVSNYSVKIVPGKAVIKGALYAYHLYTAKNGAIEYMEHEFPFTEIADIAGLNENDSCNLLLNMGDWSSHIADGTLGRQFSLSGSISFSLIAFSAESEAAVTDAFVPGRESTLSFTDLKASAPAEEKKDSLTLKLSSELPHSMPPIEKLCPVYAFVSSEKITRSNGKITVSGTVCAVISYAAEGGIYSYEAQDDFSVSFDCPAGEYFVTGGAKISHTDYNFVNQARVDVRCIADISLSVRRSTDCFRAIDSMSIGDEDAAPRVGITIYFVKSGDTLWDIAKNYKTTVEKILFANNMDADNMLNSGMRLLIPA